MKTIPDMTDEELREGLRQQSEHLALSYSIYYEEIKRRSQDRYATAMKWLTLILAVAGILAAAATIVTALKMH